MSSTKQIDTMGTTWRRMMGRAAMGAAALTLAATAAAATAGAAVASTATATAAAPSGTIRITNTNQALTGGVINSKGNGAVFTSVLGNQIETQQWVLSDDRLINKTRSRCLEAGSGGSIFIAVCAGKKSQKWAFKLAVKGKVPTGDQFRIQNFQTKDCLKIGAVNSQRNARVAAVECKAERNQNWFANTV
ncbi:ricin-type beta-trefoil lectin domain protein [Nonomuraea sp. 3N208]|uniref:ricin-type beta-trefoil lectin domain protein n=1 Tax=Nonomuraea sp. 3N208 TaxID=3457421 RepID=UPI003FD59641